MERETREIVTPVDKHKLIIKTWLTGGEEEQIERIFLSSVNVATKETKPDVSFGGASVQDANHKAIEVIVLSIDGDSNNVLKRILDFKSKDYKYVLSEIDKTRNDEEQDEKKNS